MEDQYYYTNIYGDDYNELLKILLQESSSFYLLTRKDDTVIDEAQEVLDRLKVFLIRRKKTNNWLTGTILKWRKIGCLFYYRMTAQSASVLQKSASSLFDWGGVGNEEGYLTHPQDIAFFNKRNEPMIAVNGHEEFFIVYPNFQKEFEKFIEERNLILSQE